MSFGRGEASWSGQSEGSEQLALSRYKAKVGACYPARAREILSEKGGCFLGVSLENRSFSDGKFVEMIKWVGRRSERCVILVGDCIHRKTLQIRLGLSEDEALAAALELGREFRESATRLLDRTAIECACQMIMCSEVRDLDHFDRHHELVKARFNACETFNATVHGFSKLYIDKRAKPGDAVQRAQLVQLSCEYFLEELAIFACLKDLGYPIMVYPGSFTTLQAIVEGDDPDLRAISPDGLITLHLKGR